MREITLKTASRPTTVSRAEVRKAVEEVSIMLKEGKIAKDTIPETVVVSNRLPAKSKKQ